MSKDKSHLIIGVDLGSNTIKMCAVLHSEYEEETPRVLGIVEAETESIYKGDIIDENNLIKDIEKVFNKFPDKIFNKKSPLFIIGLNADGISSISNSSHILNSNINKEVTINDLNRLEKEASIPVAMIKNKKIISTIPLRYKLDQNEIQGNPLGLISKKIEGKFLFIYSPSNYIDKIENIFNTLKLKIENLEIGIIAESIPLLNRRQKNAGTALINLGYSTTSILVFENGKLIFASVLGFGSDDITKDIALGLQISLEEAENIKLDQTLYSYSKRKLEDIIEARIEYICEKINQELEKINRKELLPGGIVLSGGGSKLNDIDSLFKKYLKLPIKLSEKEIAEFSNQQIQDPTYARVYGLTFLTHTMNHNYHLDKYVKNFFRKILNFFKKLSP